MDSGLDHGLDSGLNSGLDIWTRILIARGQRSCQITQQQVLMLLDVVSSSFIRYRNNYRRDWSQSTIFEAITYHSPCAFSKPDECLWINKHEPQFIIKAVEVHQHRGWQHLRLLNRREYWSDMQEVHTLSIGNGNAFCILALALAQTCLDHYPTSCWTNKIDR